MQFGLKKNKALETLQLVYKMCVDMGGFTNMFFVGEGSDTKRFLFAVNSSSSQEHITGTIWLLDDSGSQAVTENYGGFQIDSLGRLTGNSWLSDNLNVYRENHKRGRKKSTDNSPFHVIAAE